MDYDFLCHYSSTRHGNRRRRPNDSPCLWNEAGSRTGTRYGWSAAEAVGKLEDSEYELVLSDLHLESPQAGLQVLAHAKMVDYKPATAFLTTYENVRPNLPRRENSMFIKPVDIPGLLSKVADLISERATRRLQRELRLAGV